MGASRLSLHTEITEGLNIKNAYFQPPATIKMKYPCMIYSLSNASILHADDVTYLYTRRYQLTYVTPNPDDSKIDEIPHYFKMCSFVRHFVSDNLNHYIYDLYY